MENNILCQRAEHTALTGFFEDLLTLVQESDDSDEKERIKKALQKMTDNTSYIVLGEEGTGKTSLLKNIFQDILVMQEDMAGDICEYRYGEQELVTPLLEGYQKKFVVSEDLKGISVIDTKGLNRMGKDALGRIRQLVEKCDAIFVVMDSDNVTSVRTWDMIESFPVKRMLFFLTKCDLLSEEELNESLKKIQYYMQECNISAPVFPVSMKEGTFQQNIAEMKDVRMHIKDQLIGRTPLLDKQRQNVEETRKMLMQLGESFSLRKQQYMSDVEILNKINQSMDGYVANHKETIANLINKITEEINKDIDNYQQEIISKMDPYKIKERFGKKEDFVDYLNMVNDNYKSMMTEAVNRKIIEVLKDCLHDLEIIFQESVGYFNTRENILTLNDKFYGSLSTSRKQIVAETKQSVVETSKLYQTLSSASENLFLQIWQERMKYDARIRNREILATRGGGVTGGALGVAGGLALGAAVSATGFVTAIAASGLAVIGFIVGAFVINSIAKALYDPRAAEKMEKVTQECIEQFKSEVGRTRTEMIAQISEQIATIFQEELTAVDGCFTEFRMSVNIDEKKIPVLEQKLMETQKLLKQIDMI